MAVKDHVTQRRRQPGGAVVQGIFLGDRCITPWRRARMAHDVQGAFGYPRNGIYRFEKAHIAALSILAGREGLHAGEQYGRDPRIGEAYRAIVTEVEAAGSAMVTLMY